VGPARSESADDVTPFGNPARDAAPRAVRLPHLVVAHGERYRDGSDTAGAVRSTHVQVRVVGKQADLPDLLAGRDRLSEDDGHRAREQMLARTHETIRALQLYPVIGLRCCRGLLVVDPRVFPRRTAAR